MRLLHERAHLFLLRSLFLGHGLLWSANARQSKEIIFDKAAMAGASPVSGHCQTLDPLRPAPGSIERLVYLLRVQKPELCSREGWKLSAVSELPGRVDR